MNWLMELGYLPSFCTACYRSGRTGERFMSICKEQQIHNFCQPNAIMTLKEYLEDYASEQTKQIGNKAIEKELKKLPENSQKEIVLSNLEKIHEGSRNFTF